MRGTPEQSASKDELIAHLSASDGIFDALVDYLENTAYRATLRSRSSCPHLRRIDVRVRGSSELLVAPRERVTTLKMSLSFE